MRISDTTIEQRFSSSSSSGSCNWILLNKTKLYNHGRINPPKYYLLPIKLWGTVLNGAVPQRHWFFTVLAFWFSVPGFIRRWKSWQGNCWFTSYVHIGYGSHGFRQRDTLLHAHVILLLHGKSRTWIGFTDVFSYEMSLVMKTITESSQNNWLWHWNFFNCVLFQVLKTCYDFAKFAFVQQTNPEVQQTSWGDEKSQYLIEVMWKCR